MSTLPRLLSTAALLSLAARPATAGQVFHEPVSLAELAQQTQVLLEVKISSRGQFTAAPSRSAGRGPAVVRDPAPLGSLEFHVAIPVELPPGEARPDGKPCGDYAYGAWEVTVLGVVAEAHPQGPKAGDRLLVFPGNTATLLEMSRSECLEGVRISPIFQVFEGDEAKANTRRLLFARWAPGIGWVEALAGSWLLPAKRARAEEAFRAAIKAQRPRPPTTAAPDSALCTEDAQCAVGSPPARRVGAVPAEALPGTWLLSPALPRSARGRRHRTPSHPHRLRPTAHPAPRRLRAPSPAPSVARCVASPSPAPPPGHAPSRARAPASARELPRRPPASRAPQLPRRCIAGEA